MAVPKLCGMIATSILVNAKDDLADDLAFVKALDCEYSGAINVGGIAGNLQGAPILTNASVSNSTITGQTEVGGLVGRADGVSMANSSIQYSAIQQTVSPSVGIKFGGIAGYLQSYVSLSNLSIKHLTFTCICT